MPLVAGIHLGVDATTVEVRDADSGAVSATGAAPHPAVAPPTAEQDPTAWWTAFETAWTAAGAPTVAAVSVVGTPGLVVLDAAGEVVRPAKLAIDTESDADGGWLLKQLPDGADAWVRAVGFAPTGAATIAKLSWLHRSEAEAWARLARVVAPHDWLTLRLTGRLVTDAGEASATGYWSPTSGEYQWDLLAVVDRDRDWTTAVPEVLGPLDAAGTWQGATVGPGTTETTAAAFVAGLGADASPATGGCVLAAALLRQEPPADVATAWGSGTGAGG